MRILLILSTFLLQSHYGLAQVDLRSFPDSLIPPQTQKISIWYSEITATGDTRRQQQELFEFDNYKNLIKYDHLLYHLHEVRTYNAQNQLIELDALYSVLILIEIFESKKKN